MPSTTKTLAGLLALAATGFAQTYSDCNPTTNSSCPSDAALSTSSYTVDFTAGEDADNWSSVGTGDPSYTSSGAEFSVSAQGDSPTIQTNWYFFFGRVEVWMKAANGTGIVSTITLESDDLDEVDWEWLGGDNAQVQTDYFGKGNTTSYDRGGYSDVDDAQGTSHNYTVDWTSEAITWYIDGTVTRTLNYADAVDGTNFPQTPMRVKLGIWAGGDPDNAEGTIEWAGGETDYTAGPYTMSVQSVTVYNANPGSTYTYSDMTGDYSSIVVDTSDSANSTESASTDSTSGSSSTNSTLSGSSTTMSTATATSSSSKTTSMSSSSTATVDVTSGAFAVQAGAFGAVMVAAVVVLLN